MAFDRKRERRVLVNLRDLHCERHRLEGYAGLNVPSGFLLLLPQANARPFLNVLPKKTAPVKGPLLFNPSRGGGGV